METKNQKILNAILQIAKEFFALNETYFIAKYGNIVSLSTLAKDYSRLPYRPSDNERERALQRERNANHIKTLSKRLILPEIRSINIDGFNMECNPLFIFEVLYSFSKLDGCKLPKDFCFRAMDVQKFDVSDMVDFTAKKDDSRELLKCVCFDYKNGYKYSTNGHALKINAINADPDKENIFADKNGCAVNLGDPYPNVFRTIPQSSVPVNIPLEFWTWCKKTKAVDAIGLCKITITPESINIINTDSDWNVEKKISFDVKNDIVGSFPINFKLEYLKKIAKFSPKVVYISDNTRAVVFAESKDNSLILLMPMNIDSMETINGTSVKIELPILEDNKPTRPKGKTESNNNESTISTVIITNNDMENLSTKDAILNSNLPESVKTMLIENIGEIERIEAEKQAEKRRSELMERMDALTAQKAAIEAELLAVSKELGIDTAQETSQPKQRRKRRTKAEMEAARTAGQNATMEPQPAIETPEQTDEPESRIMVVSSTKNDRILEILKNQAFGNIPKYVSAPIGSF